MNDSMKMGLTKVITLFSILIVLYGLTAIASADDSNEVSMFYGNVTLNDADASPGTAINAYIDGKLRWGRVTDTSGKYFIDIMGNGSEDDGKAITFKVCGATADQTAVWHASYKPRLLDLTAVDDEAPAVENANANPSPIVADGVETTQLNVTVIDGCRCTAGPVAVNLSAIGGDAARVMTCIEGTDVYTVTVTAAEGTAGAHCLAVNASDVFGNCNTSVCIDLVVKDVEAPVVSNPDANPTSIVANGSHESQLNVTVVADSDIVLVTVDLSDIGGDAACVMTCIEGTDVYTATVTAAEGTAGAHCLDVNASDVFGNCNTSVCIALEVTSATSEVQFTIHLDAGWNMVSIPAVLDDPSVDTVFPMKLGSVWGWNTTIQGYESVSILEPTKGYWVLVTSSNTIPLNGSSSASTLVLETGWNMIGVLQDVPESDIPEHTGSVWGWNATIQGYESAAILEQTKGYWVLRMGDSGPP